MQYVLPSRITHTSFEWNSVYPVLYSVIIIKVILTINKSENIKADPFRSVNFHLILLKHANVFESIQCCLKIVVEIHYYYLFVHVLARESRNESFDEIQFVAVYHVKHGKECINLLL